jgi:hypothetical protein
MIYVKINRKYYDSLEDWMFDMDKDHLNFLDVLQSLYKAYTNSERILSLPLLRQLIKKEEWDEIALWNYRIHLDLYQMIADLGAQLTPPIVVIPKILKASSEEDAVYKEYLMHKDIEQFLISLEGG